MQFPARENAAFRKDPSLTLRVSIQADAKLKSNAVWNRGAELVMSFSHAGYAESLDDFRYGEQPTP